MCSPGSSLSGLALLMCPVPSSQASFRVSPTALSHCRSHNTNGLVLPALFLSGSQISPLPLQVPRRTGTVHHRSLPLPYVCKRSQDATAPASEVSLVRNIHGGAVTKGQAPLRPHVRFQPGSPNVFHSLPYGRQERVSLRSHKRADTGPTRLTARKSRGTLVSATADSTAQSASWRWR